MKRILSLFLCLVFLCGCSAWAPDEYRLVTPHQDSGVPAFTATALTATNYQGLKDAILFLVRTGQKDGTIHVTGYDGVVEDDLREAAYEVSKLDPLGAYAVDYMSHTCAKIVSYYEIQISITFRRTPWEIAAIRLITEDSQVPEAVYAAIDGGESRLALRLSDYQGQEQQISALVADYCAANAATVMEVPQVSVSLYPESGSVRILEVNFLYTSTAETLAEMEQAVTENIAAAAEYIRYRQGDYDKAQLLHSYLTNRFTYREGRSATPLYDALCKGIADPVGLAQAWQLICDNAGLECLTVSGMRGSTPHTWNILRIGDAYRHLDLSRSVMTANGLTLYTDGEMGNYYWDTEQTPACLPWIPEAPQESAPPAEEETPEASPEQETPEPPAQEKIPEETQTSEEAS